MQCLECHAILPDEAAACPACGARVIRVAAELRRLAVWTGVAGLGWYLYTHAHSLAVWAAL